MNSGMDKAEWMDRTKVVYCKKCVVSNQRPRITFDENGICSACQHAFRKQHLVDWNAREKELVELLDRHRSKDGSYDVIVPCSGGKDSSYIAHQLKHKYDMHPLTVTWASNMDTDIGRRNLKNLIQSGFSNVLFSPNGEVYRIMSRLGLEHFGDPFLPFIYGVKAFPLQMAVDYKVPLIMYAEDGEVEYGGEDKNASHATIDMKEDMVRQYFSGLPPTYWKKYGIAEEDLKPYLVPSQEELDRIGLEYRYFAYYRHWVPRENARYASEHTGLEVNAERSEGTYTRYASLDDRLDGLHYYLSLIKFGIGRATSDAAHEIRDGDITREEGVALVRQYDCEFPARHFEESLKYLDITKKRFWEIVDAHRPPHIWEKHAGEWMLKHQVS